LKSKVTISSSASPSFSTAATSTNSIFKHENMLFSPRYGRKRALPHHGL